MSKGYVVLAQNSQGIDYVRQAYALALSLRASGNQEPVSIITNDNVDDRYRWVFDQVIAIPWGDSAEGSRFKVENRWKIYHASPYDKTVVLDTDMLVLDNLSNFWATFENYKVYYTSKVRTYRNEPVMTDYYRKAFTVNALPNLYSAVHYFEKSDFAKEFYNWVELITNNWELFYGQFVSEHYPGRASMDVTAALAAKILDVSSEITNEKSDPVTFVHMKSHAQNWKTPPEQWQSAVAAYFNDSCRLKIGNFQQTGVFHYTEKDFLSDTMIEKLEAQCLTN